ncbi:HutD family protein [Collimonas humicola]|uniref:HutD/Ves family protein n=1 Tax=Collimonas humicola TaxID=2825886 RepID=UPI001B8B5EE5|nr:HutD family protein [Collimonas humicola]
MKLIEFEDLPATPWKNGGGVTRELYCQPPGASFDNFLWRVSIADVSQSGAFSSFAGVDRVITLLEGDGMDLVSDSGNHVLLSHLQPHRFRGEDKIDAQLEGGACRDFNLMLRRGAAAGEVQVWSVDQDLEQGCNLLFCVQGRWDVLTQDGEHATLAPRQSLAWDDRPGKMALRSLSAGSVLIGVNVNLK